MSQAPIYWRPNPGPQTRFCASSARELLYGGAAGGGKSDGLLTQAVRFYDCSGMASIILRRTFPMLADLIKRSQALYRPLGGTYNIAERRWTFPSGGTMEFTYLESDSDKWNYTGRAFTFIAFDELTQMPGDETDDETGEVLNGGYSFMRSRLRPPDPVAWGDRPLMIRATANPGGIGHAWVKGYFDIPDEGTKAERVDPRSGFRRVFMPARLSDNPFLANTPYQRQLESLPEALRKALLEGRWDIYEGAAFSEFNPRIHKVEPFKIPDTWEQWRGGDDGYSAPACVLWFAFDPVNERYFITREIYGGKILSSDLGRMVLEMDPVDKHFNRIELSGVLDSSAFAEVEKGKDGRGTEMNKLGCDWRPCTKNANSRLAGKARIHELLDYKKTADKKPSLVIFSNCKNLLRTLPALPIDTRRPEDVDTRAEDHAYDALRYGLQWRDAGFKRTRMGGY